MKKFMNRKGLTLIEIIAALTISTIVLVLIASVVKVSFNSLPTTEKATEAQNTVRFVSETITNRVQDAGQIVTVPQGAVVADQLKDGWSYLGLSDDKTEIVNHIYIEDTNSYRKIPLANIDTSDDCNFEVGQSASDEKLLTFTVGLHPKLASNGAGITLSGTAKADNVDKIIENGTAPQPAQGFLYRAKPAVEKKVVANVTLMIDISSSMLNDVLGDPVDNLNETRLAKLQTMLLGGVENDQVIEGLIDFLARLGDVEVCLIPYNTTANYMSDTTNWHPFYTLSNTMELDILKDKIADMTNHVKAGTNVGDALRRSYYCYEWINNNITAMPEYNANTKVKNYFFVIADGYPNLATLKHIPVVERRTRRIFLDDGPAPGTSIVEYVGVGSEQMAGLTDHVPQPHRNVHYNGRKYWNIDIEDKKFYLIGIADDIYKQVNASGYVSTKTIAQLLKQIEKYYSTSPLVERPFSRRIKCNADFVTVFSEIKTDIKQKIIEARAPEF